MLDENPFDRSETRPPQFTTRTLLAGTAACALLVVVLQAVGLVWGAAIIWFLLLIAAHVAGNLHGSHRDLDAAGIAPRGAADRASPISGGPGIAAACAPATRLRFSKGFGRALLVLTIATAVAGWLFGTAVLLLLTRADAGGVLLGGLSAGILGGFLGFVAGSFAMVATRAFREAAHEHHPLPSRGTTSLS